MTMMMMTYVQNLRTSCPQNAQYTTDKYIFSCVLYIQCIDSSKVRLFFLIIRK